MAIGTYTENRVDQGLRNSAVETNSLLPKAVELPSTSVANTANIPVPTPRPTSFDDSGKVESDEKSTDGGKTPINKDTTALKHKGTLHEDGEFGDQDLSNSTQAFKNAVGTAAGILGAAMAIKSLIPNSRPRHPVTNYYLTSLEQNLLKHKAAQFAVPGIVPYDALEDFLYIF